MAVVSSTITTPNVPPCIPGPSGLHAEAAVESSGSSLDADAGDLHAVTSSTIATAGGGESTSNGSDNTPKRPRKRPRHSEGWKGNVAKAKSAKGEAYVSPTTGKMVAARESGPACQCKRKCYDAFSSADLLK